MAARERPISIRRTLTAPSASQFTLQLAEIRAIAAQLIEYRKHLIKK